MHRIVSPGCIHHRPVSVTYLYPSQPLRHLLQHQQYSMLLLQHRLPALPAQPACTSPVSSPAQQPSLLTPQTLLAPSQGPPGYPNASQSILLSPSLLPGAPGWPERSVAGTRALCQEGALCPLLSSRCAWPRDSSPPADCCSAQWSHSLMSPGWEGRAASSHFTLLEASISRGRPSAFLDAVCRRLRLMDGGRARGCRYMNLWAANYLRTRSGRQSKFSERRQADFGDT